MLSRKVSEQRSKRRSAIFSVIVIMICIGYVFAYRHRQIKLMDYLGLSEYVGRPFLEVMTAMGVEEGIEAIRSSFLLLVTLFPGAVLNTLPVLVALVAVFWVASHFIRTLYDTKDWGEAYELLDRNMFGMRELRPLMIVKEGHIFVGEGELHDRIGGRALLLVYNDSAVVIERGGHLVRVVGPSLSFIKPFERVWGIVDLRVQRWPLTVNAMTKEGIPISCEAIITFKIDDRYKDEHGEVRVKQPVETETPQVSDREIVKELEKAGIAEPLSYTKEAVFNAATCNWIRIHQEGHPEQLRRWTGRVIIGGTEGTLRSILADYRLDWLLEPTQPGKQHPRDEVREKLEQKLQNSFSVGNSVGAKVVGVELGEIKVRDVEDQKGEKMEIPDEVYTQWIDAWQSEWERRAIEDQIEGEAELARLQAAQIEAQAEMALTLTEAIRPLVEDKEDVSSYLLATRFVETLRWMAYDPFKRAFMPPEIMRTIDELENELMRAKLADEVRASNKDASIISLEQLLQRE
jgi:hypothetical protein